MNKIGKIVLLVFVVSCSAKTDLKTFNKDTFKVDSIATLNSNKTSRFGNWDLEFNEDTSKSIHSLGSILFKNKINKFLFIEYHIFTSRDGELLMSSSYQDMIFGFFHSTAPDYTIKTEKYWLINWHDRYSKNCILCGSDECLFVKEQLEAFIIENEKELINALKEISRK